MPMPKITDLKQINIGANGLDNQAGRAPKTLDIKVIRSEKAEAKMAELAQAKAEAAAKTEG